MSLKTFDIQGIWFPIIHTWLETYFTTDQVIYLVIDRTSWGCINLLMISVVWEKRALTIYFELLPKLGNSNFTEQQAALTKVIPIFKKYKTVVLGDREFCSVMTKLPSLDAAITAYKRREDIEEMCARFQEWWLQS